MPSEDFDGKLFKNAAAFKFSTFLNGTSAHHSSSRG